MAARKLPFRREPTGTPEGDRAQLLAQEQQRGAVQNPLANARLVDTELGGTPGAGLVFVAGTARSIPHGLGRPAVGFMEAYGADVVSAARVGLFASALPANLTSRTHIAVTPTSSGTCYIVVF